MAYGLPDYYRGVDIKLQSLAEVTSRPKYGGAILSAGSVYVWAGVLTGLVQINGKGMVYGGSVWLEPDGAQSNSMVWLGIDGENIEGLSFERLKKYGVVDPRSAVISLNVFNSTDYVYSAGIAYGLTFETRLDLQYKEAHDDRCTVHYRIIYTLI